MARALKKQTTVEAVSVDKTRERILVAATPLFAQSGFHGVSMRDVAAALGVTPAALYYHYSDKEHLYLALVEHVFNRGVRDALAGTAQPGTPWQRLEALVTGFSRMMAGETDLQRLMQWVLLDTDEARSRRLTDGVFKPVYQIVSALVREISPGTDSFPRVMFIFSLLVFPFESARVARFMPGFRSPHDDPDELAERIMDLLREGLVPENSPGERP